MTSSDTNARHAAHLWEYLIHEAVERHSPEQVTIANAPEDDRIGISFPSGRLCPLPKEPPPQYRPSAWHGATATLEDDPDGGIQRTRWSWTPGSGHWAPQAQAYAIELLRFCRARVYFNYTMAMTGRMNPLELNTIGVEQEIEPGIHLLIVEEQTNSGCNWDHETQRSSMRPNVIYQSMGVSRYCSRIAREGRWTGHIGRLDDGEARGPARTFRLECRVVLTEARNRSRLRYPATSGLKGGLSDLIRKESRELLNRWAEERESLGYAVSGRTGRPNGTIIMGAPVRPYEPSERDNVATVAREPVMVQTHRLDPQLAPGLWHAMVGQTDLTPIAANGRREGVTADITGITYTTRGGRSIPVDVSTGVAGDEAPLRQKRNRPEIVADIEAEMSIGTADADGRAETDTREVRLTVPALIVRSGDRYGDKLLITEAATETMSREQVITLIDESTRSRDHNWTAVQADLALCDRATAFRRELAARLDEKEPESGYPERPITITFGPDGMVLDEDEGGTE